MTGDVNSLDFMLDIQGQQCLVYRHVGDDYQDHLMTFVHVVDTGGARSLRLCTRGKKPPHLDYKVSQKLLEAIKPARDKTLGYSWEVSLRS